jgi:DnaJ-domain-containing protein 1
MIRWAIIGLVAFLVYRWVRRAMDGGGPRLEETGRPASGGRLRDRPPHEVLGVDEDASESEIKAAYQKAIRENHPDRVADMSEELRALAEKKTREANDAYAKLTGKA